ncbi:hypothetical protein AYL99_08539 [Fonsecaea erecta]|uniref:Uncharacterized protein n=1 Tax=Fonsecaea erecta TaxID=1367422 RepID=A0A178ZEA0_9EURO|nr:hypothetical protein AYL99_08539 [Fonsecaea erecta]OAP57801.1 hypothetical protein AYL99_08539 [Fonsecaea erecta]
MTDTTDPTFGTIFRFPGLDPVEFAAAAYVLETTRHQQDPLAPPEAAQIKRVHHKDTDLGRFLDSIAYIFGRFKGKRAAAHVSAAALCHRPDDSGRSDILVTKNNCFGKEDRDFAKVFQKWLEDTEISDLEGIDAITLPKHMLKEILGSAKTGETGQDNVDLVNEEEEKDDPEDDSHDTVLMGAEQQEDAQDEQMWCQIMAFCYGRQLHYIAQICRSDALDDEGLDAMFSGDDKATVQRARQIVKWCREFHDESENSSDTAKLVASYKQICTKSVDFRRRNKSGDDHICESIRKKPQAQPFHARRPKDARPLFAAIHMLGRLRADWGKIKQHKASSGQKFSIVIVSNNRWRNFQFIAKSVREKMSVLWPQYGQLLKIRPPNAAQNYIFYFHCEIQMLHYIRSNGLEERCENYFGCSKKSCWTCWAILSHDPKFRTGDTHAKVFWKCAFPLTHDLQTNANRVILRGLLALQRNMADQVLDLSLRGAKSWVKRAEVNQTTDHDTHQTAAEDLGSSDESGDETAKKAWSSTTVTRDWNSSTVATNWTDPWANCAVLKIAQDRRISIEQLEIFNTSAKHLRCYPAWTQAVAPEFLIRDGDLGTDRISADWLQRTVLVYPVGAVESQRSAVGQAQAFFRFGESSNVATRNRWTLDIAASQGAQQIPDREAWWLGDIYVFAVTLDGKQQNVTPERQQRIMARVHAEFAQRVAERLAGESIYESEISEAASLHKAHRASDGGRRTTRRRN